MPPPATDPVQSTAVFDRPPVESPSFRYAIFSQPRTGSTWLGAHLSNRGFGLPFEYLNEAIVPALSRRLLGQAWSAAEFRLGVYMTAVERVRTSANGCFGAKIQPNQLYPLVGNRGDRAVQALRRYDRLILLERRDKLGQAVSHAIALLTNQWFTGGRDPDVSSVPMDRLIQQTAVSLGRSIEGIGRMKKLCAATGRPVLTLVYEDMVADEAGTMAEVERFLGWPSGPATETGEPARGVPEKPPGKVAAEVRARFLDYIQGRGPA